MEQINADIASVEELTKTLKSLNVQFQSAEADRKLHENLAKEFGVKSKAAYTQYWNTKQQLRFSQHLAEGKCAKLLRDGDSYHPTYTPCKHKAKPESRFCGVHKQKGK